MGYCKFIKSMLKGIIKDFKFMFKYWDIFTKEERFLMENIKYYTVSDNVIKYYKKNVNRNKYTTYEQCENKIKRNIIMGKSCKSFTDSYLEYFHYGNLTIKVNHRTHMIEDIQNIKGKFGIYVKMDSRKKELLNEYFEVNKK